MKPRHLLTGILVLPIVLLALYLGARHTDAYGRAVRFVSRDARVTSLIGAVDKVGFRFWHGFTYTGDQAAFSFDATSRKGAFIIDVRLRHRPGAWRVEDADIRTRDGSETYIMLH